MDSLEWLYTYYGNDGLLQRTLGQVGRTNAARRIKGSCDKRSRVIMHTKWRATTAIRCKTRGGEEEEALIGGRRVIVINMKKSRLCGIPWLVV